MSFVEYNGDKSCFICGNYEKLLINRNDELDFELVLCVDCITNFKIVLKKK